MYPSPNAQAVACPWHLCLRLEPELCPSEIASQPASQASRSPQSVHRVMHAKGNHTQLVLPWFFILRPALGNVAKQKRALDAEHVETPAASSDCL